MGDAESVQADSGGDPSAEIPEPQHGYAYLTVSTALLDYGIVLTGNTVLRNLQLGNAGSAPLLVDAIEVTPAPAGETLSFGLEAPFALMPGMTATETVWLHADAPGVLDCELRLVSNSATGPDFAVRLVGEVVATLCVDKDQDGFGPYCPRGDDCDDTDAEVRPHATEWCNGVDDDCDGGTDEDWLALTMPCGLGRGACATEGTYVCAEDQASVRCAGNPLTGGDELCNEVDDDCDGETDEDFPGLGHLCTVGTGACIQADKVICAADGLTSVCNVTPLLPGVEIEGDGIDNDCDGEADELLVVPGCADGGREGYEDLAADPDIAACSGGWSVAGVVAALDASCQRQGGDDGVLPDGEGCNVTDLCADGWHVCEGALEVEARSPTGCAGAASTPGLFFATRQTGTGCGMCATGTLTGPTCGADTCKPGCAPAPPLSNDVFGCGTLGMAPSLVSCAPLDRFSHNNCGALGKPWSCSGGTTEASNVVKTQPQGGGVLCCRDAE